MHLGDIDRENREYVLRDPRTPVKWINYIGTREFGGFVDHTGGALICRGDPTFNRITRYILQLPSSDFKGETLYLRLHTGGGYRCLSPFFVPGLEPLELFECRFGLGYTRIISEHLGLRTEVTIFVPRGEHCELRDVRITNVGDADVMLDLVPLVEYSHPDAMQQLTNADWLPQTMQSRAVVEGKQPILLQYPFMTRDTRVNYFTSNCPASSFETDRRLFLGENEYGSFKAPLSLARPQLSNSEANRGDNVAVLLHPLGVLVPGESRRVILQLGQAENLASARGDIERFRQPEVVDRALNELHDFWNEYLDALQVRTPDADMQTMLNLFNPYQCYVTKTWSRYLSYYQPGLGARGIGYRDSMQDVMSVLPFVPEEAREFIETLLSFQKPDGSAMHQFNPLTMIGSEGDSLEMEDRPHTYGDDHLWGVLAAAAYLKETGDLAFLDQHIPFYSGDQDGQHAELESVLEHLRRALDYTARHTGEHGLPLLGFADWNDTVNLPSGAESLFVANLYGKALLEMIELCEHLGDVQAVDAYRQAYESMKNRVESTAWDSAWYIRYFDEAGQPIGSTDNIHGRIWLNAQTWPVISGFASPERARQALDAAHEQLNTRYGLKLSTPGYDGYDPRLGGVTTYPPGAKENGGIFLHPNPWAVIAEAMLGNGERAHRYYAQINPMSHNDRIEVYECEPFVYAQNILGDEHPQHGLARNSWLTGTASWCYLAATQWILGIRPEYSGLRLDPCIPRDWPGYTAERKFRGRRYRIKVNNPQGVCRGVVKVEVDGLPMPDNLIPLDPEGEEHKVEVWLGGEV
jgi:cellobiose phosphorylase